MGPVLVMMRPVMSLSLTDHGRVPLLTEPGHVELLLVLGQERGEVPRPGQLVQPLVDGDHLVPGEEPVPGLRHGLVAPVIRGAVMMRRRGILVIIVLCWSVHSLPAPFRLSLPLLCLLLEHFDLGELEAEPRTEDVHGYLPPVRVSSHSDVCPDHCDVVPATPRNRVLTFLLSSPN